MPLKISDTILNIILVSTEGHNTTSFSECGSYRTNVPHFLPLWLQPSSSAKISKNLEYSFFQGYDEKIEDELTGIIFEVVLHIILKDIEQNSSLSSENIFLSL
mmetsp:Transcript_6426/g.13891  ORF Transcript_6426/g.13891 Transcript_6426/m.13891 type:complete len:103 (-) Transcript_6426:354-662(-)